MSSCQQNNSVTDDLKKEVRDLFLFYKKSLDSQFPGLLTRFPVDKYKTELNKYSKTVNYKYVGDTVAKTCSDIEALSSRSCLEIFHRIVLLDYIEEAFSSERYLSMPESIVSIMNKNFLRIIHRMKKVSSKQYYVYENDKFCKDMAICRLIMIPLGAQKVYPGKLSRKIFFKGGVKQFFRVLILVLRTGRMSPVYRMHTDSGDRDLMKDFNEKGWMAFYDRVGIMVKKDRKIIGLCGTSWFFDPKVKEFCPELAYLRDTAEKAGAEFFFAGVTESARRDALFMSKKRMELYKNKLYTPALYMMFISRKNLICRGDNESPGKTC